MTPKLLALLVAVVLACSSQAASAQENVLNVGKYGQLSSYDPHAGALDTMWWTLNNFYESLVDLNDDISGLRPVLATAWQVAPSGKIYTLTLRSGVKFNDGTAFDAAAVKVSVERAQALKKAASLYVKPIVKVETPAPTTVVFHLDKPNNAFLAGLRFLLIVSPKAVHDNDKGGDNAEGWLRDHTAGTGPYTLEKWEPNIIHVARKNPGYWRGWPANKFTTLNLRHIYEPETQRLMLEKGELDIAENVTKDSLPALKRNAALTVYEKAGTTLMVTFLNTQAGPTKDLRVRQALHHLWNQEAFNAIVGHTANAGPLYPPLLGRDWKMENPYPYNPARAKQLLAEAGYPNGGFQLRYQSQKGDVDKRAMFEIFQAELAKLNVTMELYDDTWPALVKRATDWGATRDAGTAVHMFGYFRPMFIPTPYDFLFQMYHSDAFPTKGGRNFTYYSNPEYDRLINDSVVSLDAPREQRQLRQAAEMLWKDAAVVVNGRIVDKIVTRKDVKGFVYQGDRISYRYWDLYRVRCVVFRRRSGTGAPRPSMRLPRVLRGGPFVVGSALVLLVLLAMMIVPSVFTRRDPNAIEFLSRLRPPSLTHPFGTDENGRDLWARVVYGARPTLAAAVSLIAVAAVLGSIVGLLIGAAGRAADEWLMRVTELFLAFPQIVWALAFATVVGRGLVTCVIALAITWWAQYARLMRGQVLVYREREFILTARALGQRQWRILLFHLLPNCLSPVLVKATIDVSLAILLLAALSFLGVGAQPPLPEWGAMVTIGRKYLLDYPWYATFPGLAIFVTVLSFNVLGERVRDVLDPQSRIGERP